ncbi:MAG: TonB family protein [Pyrinomonadaceae bacterium]
MLKIIVCGFAFAAFFIGGSAIFAQQTEHQGIALYHQGKYAEAISVLNKAVKQKESKTDANLWNALGLANTAVGDFKKAKKAFENATSYDRTNSNFWSNLAYAKLRLRDLNGAQSAADKAIAFDPKNATAYYIRGLASLWELNFDEAQKNADIALATNPKFADSYILSALIQMGRLGKEIEGSGSTDSIRENVIFLKNAVDILNTGLTACGDCPKKANLQKELEPIDFFFKNYSKEKPKPPVPGVIPVPEPGVTPYKVLSKPRATYTQAAREANVQGTIRIIAMLGTNGRVDYVFVLKGLGHGLDEQAIAAARAIKFEPKIKDGKPVPVVITLEYGFSIR